MFVLLALVLILFLAGITRVGVTAGYRNGAPVLAVHIGPVTVRPLAEKDKPAKARKTKEAAPKIDEKKSWLSTFHKGEALRAILRAVSRFWGSLHVDALYFSFTAGHADAAKAAIQYGYACAVVSGLMPFVRHKRKIRKEQVLVRWDYALPRPHVEGSIKVTVRIGAVLGIGLLLLADLWRCRIPETQKGKA